MTTLIFQVDRPQNLIHSVSEMTITKNKDNTFNVFYSVDWYRESTTEFDYRNVPKEYVFDLVTGPSWISNGTKVFAHDVDVSVLKKFIFG
tara:strand:- start:171 stop:440 length:270 start_codon:yes stop_codon:yes gene_type:complete